ncbi:MAG: helix-turn-helix domain-containing protein [Pyrinomonadaceae bacterium]|jgi:excisionase family DNA binding protein|nr:helix-turn-helix domain-containing protein [Pyrinomonadaceae bacterium]
MENDEFLTPEEAAKLLKVTRRTIYNWLKAGKLPALKYGQGWRIIRSELIRGTRERAA